MLLAEDPATDAQGFAEALLRLLVVSTLTQQDAKIVEHQGGLRMIGPEGLATNGQCLAVEGFGRVEISAPLQGQSEVL